MTISANRAAPQPSKTDQLLALARKRQQARWPECNNLADYHGGLYECDHVSPYTISAGNPDSEILVIFKEWVRHERLAGPPDHQLAKLGYSPDSSAHIHLSRLLEEYFGKNLREVYVSALFPFIHHAPSSRHHIPASQLRQAALEYGFCQMAILQPRLVVCLGPDAFNALACVCGIYQRLNLASSIRNPFTWMTTTVWCQAHPGSTGRNNRNWGGVNRVDDDWERMAAYYLANRRRA